MRSKNELQKLIEHERKLAKLTPKVVSTPPEKEQIKKQTDVKKTKK
jgi:hypothetical protein